MTPADLAAARNRLGFTQTGLADALGVHALSVSKWERGVHPIPKWAALAVARLEAPVEISRKPG